MKCTPVIVGVAAALVVAGGYALYQLGLRNGMRAVVAPATSVASAAAVSNAASRESGEDATRRHMQAGLRAGDIDPANGRKILYYHDPMVPANRFDKPGKSPFMDMMMSPVYADANSDSGTVIVSPRIRQSLGIRTTEVIEGTLSPQVSAEGSIAFNERNQAVVQARATGYLERLYVGATLDSVRRGQPLAELYVPDWIAAQEEFLSLRRMIFQNSTTAASQHRQAFHRGSSTPMALSHRLPPTSVRR